VNGECAGDCALGTETVMSLAWEEQQGAIKACFPRTVRANLTLRLSISRSGKVVRATPGSAAGAEREARCLALAFGTVTFPPGSDPSAAVILHVEVDRQIDP
jgi:hypothetical protein